MLSTKSIRSPASVLFNQLLNLPFATSKFLLSSHWNRSWIVVRQMTSEVDHQERITKRSTVQIFARLVENWSIVPRLLRADSCTSRKLATRSCRSAAATLCADALE